MSRSRAEVRTASPDFENITLDISGPVARLTLARADKLNPLDWETVKELFDAVKRIERNPDVAVVVVTGKGRSFSAGGDLDGYIRLYANPDQFDRFLGDFADMLGAIEASRCVFIASVNGVCVAGGLELLLACDLVIAADTAKIGDGHLNFGQLPGAGGSQRLPRAIGMLRAKDLILSGELLTAAEAERIGLVNRVVPADELDDAVDRRIASLLKKSRVGLAGAKHLVNITAEKSLEDGLAYERAYVHRYATTEPDATEGLYAFKEKRKPKFSHDV